MGDEQLNPQQKAYLRFLRNEVDKYEREANRTDYHPKGQQDLFRARKELKEYRLKLQRNGVKI